MASSTTSDSQPGGRSKAYTPPKGAPTKGRGEVEVRRRLFGATAQWITLAIVIVAIVAILIWVTGDGIFNPVNTNHGGAIVMPLVASLL